MRSSRPATVAAVVFGLLAIASIPASVLAAQRLAGVSLLRALYVGIPVAFALGAIAVLASRRARYRAARSVFPTSPRLARVIAWAGLWSGLTGGIALAVYALLRLGQ